MVCVYYVWSTRCSLRVIILIGSNVHDTDGDELKRNNKEQLSREHVGVRRHTRTLITLPLQLTHCSQRDYIVATSWEEDSLDFLFNHVVNLYDS